MDSHDLEPAADSREDAHDVLEGPCSGEDSAAVAVDTVTGGLKTDGVSDFVQDPARQDRNQPQTERHCKAARNLLIGYQILHIVHSGPRPIRQWLHRQRRHERDETHAVYWRERRKGAHCDGMVI